MSEQTIITLKQVHQIASIVENCGWKISTLVYAPGTPAPFSIKADKGASIVNIWGKSVQQIIERLWVDYDSCVRSFCKRHRMALKSSHFNYLTQKRNWLYRLYFALCKNLGFEPNKQVELTIKQFREEWL